MNPTETATVDPLSEEAFVLSRDLKKAAATLTDREARFLVDAYYQAQDDRIRNANQSRAASQAEEPHAVLDWFSGVSRNVENSIRGALTYYVRSKPLGKWCVSIHGIGPVISAGLMANIDIQRAPTVGHIWRFAGLDPTTKWNKGEKRPWNASLKRLCFLIGDSFMKHRNSEKDVYGKVYAERKALEIQRNEAGEFKDQAATSLKEKKIKDKKLRECYEAGRLPDGRIELRARRYATKLFLSHFHHVAYVLHHGEDPPKPYVLDHLNHAHFISPPNWPMES